MAEATVLTVGFEPGGTAAWSAAAPEAEGGRTGDSV